MQPKTGKQRKLTKLEQARWEYENNPSYSFMGPKTSKTLGLNQRQNYWIQNQEIINSYASYYNMQKLQPSQFSQSVPPRKGDSYMKTSI